MSDEIVTEGAHKAFHLMSALAVRKPFDDAILPEARQAGYTVEIDWLPTTVILTRLKEGATPDAVLVLDDAMDRLIAEGRVDAATRVPVVASQLGLAVKAGAPHPDISTEAAFRDALLSARSVAYSIGGASGIYFMKLLDRLGIRAEIDAKASTIPQGFTAECIADGRADLAVQQISELLVVPGIEIAGPFPPTLQQTVTFSIAALATASRRATIGDFSALLKTDSAVAAYALAGLDAR